MSYEKLFQKKLLMEEDGAPINMSPEPEISDEEAWAQQNPDIADNEEMSTQFDTQGLDSQEIEKYSAVISKWNDGLQNAISQLAQIIKFSTSEKLSNAPGSDQFSKIIDKAPDLKMDLSGFKSQVEDLAETVKLAIRDARNERKDKLKSLR